MCLDKLCKELRACTLCSSQLPFPAKPIFQLHANAKILIAGQAPGHVAHNAGRAFADASGKRLRQWMGIDETVFYDAEKIAILPMGLCYPGHSKSGDLAPVPQCAQHWRNKILPLLPHVRLTLLLGGYAQKWHVADCAQKNLTEMVQQWRLYYPGIMPLPHPSPRNNAWLKHNPWFEQELLPILRIEVAKVLKLS